MIFDAHMDTGNDVPDALLFVFSMKQAFLKLEVFQVINGLCCCI